MDDPTDFPTLETGERRFLGQMAAFDYFPTLEDAAEAWQKVMTCAKEHGFEIMDASIHNAREREPVEQMTWGSTQPYRNILAEQSWGSMAGETSTTRQGAEKATQH